MSFLGELGEHGLFIRVTSEIPDCPFYCCLCHTHINTEEGVRRHITLPKHIERKNQSQEMTKVEDPQLAGLSQGGPRTSIDLFHDYKLEEHRVKGTDITFSLTPTGREVPRVALTSMSIAVGTFSNASQSSTRTIPAWLLSPQRAVQAARRRCQFQHLPSNQQCNAQDQRQ